MLSEAIDPKTDGATAATFDAVGEMM